MTTHCVIAIDPGKDKCGVAVVDHEQGALLHQVVPTEQLLIRLAEWLPRYGCRLIVLGDQTFSVAVRESLQSLIDQKKIEDIVLVDERKSTETARFRYWQAYPPTGWRRFLPIGLLLPPCAVDDFAAIILGERYFQKNI